MGDVAIEAVVGPMGSGYYAAVLDACCLLDVSSEQCVSSVSLLSLMGLFFEEEAAGRPAGRARSRARDDVALFVCRFVRAHPLSSCDLL